MWMVYDGVFLVLYWYHKMASEIGGMMHVTMGSFPSFANIYMSYYWRNCFTLLCL